MGAFETEQELIAAGKAERGYTVSEYFAELDEAAIADLDEDEKEAYTRHRPDYSDTLLAPENEDIYQEFCAYVDLPEPRGFDQLPDQMQVEGFTANDVFVAMASNNGRLRSIDGAAVYNMLCNLRSNPQMYLRVLDFQPPCCRAGSSSRNGQFTAMPTEA